MLNRNKSEGVWIGKLKNCKYKIAGINWTDKPIKSLGIYVGNNNEETQKLNWENKIEKMNKLFCAWGKRNLSILGKCRLVATLDRIRLCVFGCCRSSLDVSRHMNSSK